MTRSEAEEVARAIGQMQDLMYTEIICAELNKRDLPFLWTIGYTHGPTGSGHRKRLAEMVFVTDRATASGIVVSCLNPSETPDAS